ncbi:hypothetical protein EV356DRAFT_499967 [Viridothelium virens]|uniref:F-box domain-containing protein n=1 Tax=Viridothelium virens TaxID=1048519 RepID=A0A6A6HPG3_VIRVR|nr:hypothetical protein EV356DRAFT_499967 [Viridothelium virens]
MAAPKTAATRFSLNDLCDELLLNIFHYLDVPDLLTASRTSRRFRKLSTDPILHAQRRRLATQRLSVRLPARPPLSSLLPPSSTIYLTTTHVAARTLSRALVAIKLNRCLSRRPSAASLIDKGVLPKECFVREKAAGGDEAVRSGVAWGIVEARRRVERERVKDGLRVWVGRMAGKIQSGRVERTGCGVWSMVWRFSRGERGRRERERSARREEAIPGRSRVGGLRRFWEEIAEGQNSSP